MGNDSDVAERILMRTCSSGGLTPRVDSTLSVQKLLSEGSKSLRRSLAVLQRQTFYGTTLR